MPHTNFSHWLLTINNTVKQSNCNPLRRLKKLVTEVMLRFKLYGGKIKI